MHERVGDLLQRGRVLVFISPRASVRETAQVMDEHNVGSVLVMDDENKLRGIFTERDLVKRVVSPGADPDQTQIADVMTTDVIVVDTKTPASEVFQLMDRHKCRHIPVADGDRILGVVSLRDLLRRDRKMKELEIKQMRTYFLDAGYPG